MKSKLTKKNKIIIIIGSIVIIGLILFFVYYCFIRNNESSNKDDNNITDNNKEYESDTGAFHRTEILSENYVLAIDSEEVGHPSGNSSFSASTSINNKEYGGKKYTIWYNVDYSNIFEKNPKEDYPNYDSYEKIYLGGKTFKYTMNDKSIKLIYQSTDNGCYFTIDVKISNVFRDDGNTSQDIVNILLDDLNYKELLGIINFELKKK